MSARPSSMLGAPSNDLRVQVIRYLVVGGVAFVVDYSLLLVLTELGGVHYLTSAAVGFLAGLGVNYLLSVRWVFASRRVETKSLEFGMFALIGLVGLGVNEVVIWAQVDFAGVHYAIAKLVAVVVTWIWNFSARKYLLFR